VVKSYPKATQKLDKVPGSPDGCGADVWGKKSWTRTRLRRNFKYQISKCKFKGLTTGARLRRNIKYQISKCKMEGEAYSSQLTANSERLTAVGESYGSSDGRAVFFLSADDTDG
jgi:hypothetical protein